MCAQTNFIPIRINVAGKNFPINGAIDLREIAYFEEGNCSQKTEITLKSGKTISIAYNFVSFVGRYASEFEQINLQKHDWSK